MVLRFESRMLRNYAEWMSTKQVACGLSLVSLAGLAKHGPIEDHCEFKTSTGSSMKKKGKIVSKKKISTDFVLASRKDQCAGGVEKKEIKGKKLKTYPHSAYQPPLSIFSLFFFFCLTAHCRVCLPAMPCVLPCSLVFH